MIFMSAGELWAAVIGVAAALGAAWYLAGVVFRAAARRWRKRMHHTPPPGHPVWRNPRAQPMAGPMVPVPGVTLQVTPCGCIWYHRDTVREPCPGHRAAAADRAEINRLDQQIRRMP